MAGRLTVDEAVRRALAGSTLVAEHRAGAVLIREARGAGGGPGADSLDQAAITVTGTRIRGGSPASPVVVTTRRALEQSGISDLAGFARVLPENYTGGQNPGIAGGGEQGGQSNVNNSATLNLRGLGPDATLTLVDGHRLAYDALDQGIDISVIPLAAVDRIEVITDGASAVYGSDAVAGVANIILRRDYDGLEASARAGASTEGGNAQQEYSVVAGRRWTSGGLMVALDLSGASPIHANQRDYTKGLDPTLTLTMRNRQLSGVMTAHQQVTGGISIELDGFAMNRRSLKQSPFFPDESVFENGLVSRPAVRSYAFTPTVRIELPHHWRASLAGTRGVSRTHLDTSVYFSGTGSRSLLTYENRLSGMELGAEGPLFRAPGGDARLAIGGGLRTVSLHDNITDIISNAPVPYRDFTERRHVEFAYGELSLPLAGRETGIPLVEQLILSGALRYERWNGIDAVATPKLGVVYKPDSGLALRATWGRSFKVPTLEQVHEVPQGVLLPGFLFAPQPTPPLAPGATVLLLGGGNPNLQSERATTWSATLEATPRVFSGLRLQATYFDVDYRDRIGSPLSGTLAALANPVFSDLVIFNPTLEQVNALVASFPQGLSNQTGQTFDPASVGAIIDGTLRNTARQRIRGVDLSADYRLQLGGKQQLLFNGSASYLESNDRLAPNEPPFQMAGTIFNPPHWRGRTGALWEGRLASLSAYLNYIGPTRDNRFPAVETVRSFVTLDVSASVLGGTAPGPLRNTELRLSALNLLGEKPDIIRNSQPEAPPYDSTNQSPVGRFISLSLRKVW